MPLLVCTSKNINSDRPFSGFWAAVPRPMAILAPMEDVTDWVFRRMLGLLGKPDVFYTEFVQAAGIATGRSDSLRRLPLHQGQRPIVAQIWGNDPEMVRVAVLKLRALGYDGVDLNMGCPQHKITVKGCCAGLIRTPSLAQELVLAAQAGASERGGTASLYPHIPVSVKTRASFKHPPEQAGVESWFSAVLSTKPAVFTVHGRSAEQQSEGSADWAWVKLAVSLRNQVSPATLVCGNGDITSRQDGLQRCQSTEADGFMVGRGLFANPQLFSGADFQTLSRKQKLSWALTHLNLYEDYWGIGRNYEVMKKFFKIYIQGFPDAEVFRERIMQTHDFFEARDILVANGAVAFDVPV